MKSKVTILIMSMLFGSAIAQDRTTVNAMSSEISDNLDLRAVASIFGDSKDLEDFEYRLNDPKNQLSNLDLNNDNKVDYLRVIESTEGRTHIIVIQSILGRDLFQDVATVEVERDNNNRVQIQVVGDVYMYGSNYIYEPVYVHTPIIYNHFWVPNYRPYCSMWYWDYYPTFYYTWTPCPIFRYRNNIGLFINFNHHYNYVSYRRCNAAYINYYGRRANGYERQHPNHSFSNRHSGYVNRYELDKTRNIRTVGSTNSIAATTPRGNSNVKSDTPRNATYDSPRGNSNVKSDTPRNASYDSPRGNSNVKSDTPRNASYDSPRGNSNVKSNSPRNTSYDSPRGNSNVKNDTPRNASYDSPRGNSNVKSESSSQRGNNNEGSSRSSNSNSRSRR